MYIILIRPQNSGVLLIMHGKHTKLLNQLSPRLTLVELNVFETECILRHKNIISFSIISISMMTSSNGNIFRVTGHLCGKFTGPRWIPRPKASDAKLSCFLWSWINRWVNNREVGDLRRYGAHYDVIVMSVMRMHRKLNPPLRKTRIRVSSILNTIDPVFTEYSGFITKRVKGSIQYAQRKSVVF